jgi:hypothetical protein
MSYEKIEAVTGGSPSPAMISFYYEFDKLFNSAILRTGYRAKNVKDQGGNAQIDDFMLSPDEKSIVKEYLEQGLYDTAGELFKITGGVKDPIFFDVDYTPVGSTELESKVCGFKILDNVNYNENVVGNIDKKILNCLRYYILREWYISTSMTADAQIAEAQFKEYLTKMKNLSFELRKPLMS